MNLRKTIYIFVMLLIAVMVYFLYKGINYSSQNSPGLTVTANDSVKTDDSSKLEGNIPSQNVTHDSDKNITQYNIRQEKENKDEVKLIVYYFHATARCTECINIENFTKEIVEKEFSKEKKSVKMIFRPLNIEDSVNDHYIDDFKLDVSTVILSKVINNKQVGWKNLEHVWKYADDKPLFFKYVKNGIKDFLK